MGGPGVAVGCGWRADVCVCGCVYGWPWGGGRLRLALALADGMEACDDTDEALSLSESATLDWVGVGACV